MRAATPRSAVDDESGRRYAGRRPDERRAARHRALTDAGLEVFGTTGYDDVTIGLLCATAKVGTRAFYELFESREALLLDVASRVVLDGVRALQAAVDAAEPSLEARVRAGLSAYLRFLTDDPRRVRVAYAAVPAAGVLTAERHQACLAFAELITAQSADLALAPRAVDNPLLALALTGAVGELLGWWASQPAPPPVDELVEELVALFLRALAP